MPSQAAHVSDEATAIAPDGIPIHAFELAPAAYVGMVEGRIPPGSHGIHRHLSLEQYTYVLSGAVTAVTGGGGRHPGGAATALGPGDLLLTLPGESLQFVNEAEESARVLFICAPPYPPDNADTRVLTRHGPLDGAEMGDAVFRLEHIRATFNRIIDARIAALSSGPMPRLQRGCSIADAGQPQPARKATGQPPR